MSLPITSTCVGGRHAAPTVRAEEQPIVIAEPKRWADRNPYSLTGRECQVVEALIKGHTQVQIAELFFISIRTVNQHVESAKQKADAATVLHLAIKYDRATR